MKNIFSGLKKPGRSSSRKGPDQEFGTGLWRHNRDRFLRGVDRYYTTSVAIHELPANGRSSADDQASAVANEHSSTTDVNTVIEGTQRLNDLVPTVDEITAWLHTHHPVSGQVVPGHTRKAVGDTPELLTKASSKVAEAVLAASMARTEIIAGRPIGPSAQATERFITDAAELLGRARESISGGERP
ncbi:hypothetical protein [Brevibacterium sp.]|uniref:hypothetical protein n=1 Tax=Brevibacterium sp. TaxID=1701 RepID=UPI00264A2673|nr:hypothetical protein [Brevibacterium sp.]MDN5808412.1 hypothetical protein [Brevibacterium sp.]MDN5834293.1 hypothetical protein [Brevibacterium sp.]MDN5876898.1 hypothetical protein [Brevibacterium sp.]MDN6135451.1 hypothetical protein [Brevibacterium sp.]MDN6158950.1 hypothetical protein [Brevibacterium sp.]